MTSTGSRVLLVAVSLSVIVGDSGADLTLQCCSPDEVRYPERSPCLWVAMVVLEGKQWALKPDHLCLKRLRRGIEGSS